ncbi:MAG: lasso peptide biosynthesis B2 protein, partial [Proteobacteria bacterium]|nr:lasso peptide biosynthesis B2 protein [Pseudomonadota bacterium]
MNLLETIQSFILVPQAFKHITLINDMLISKGLLTTLELPSKNIKQIPLKPLVKSYFLACRLKPKTLKCLPRSIALFQRLKSQGLDVKHQIGVYKTGNKLSAHAWVTLFDTP